MELFNVAVLKDEDHEAWARRFYAAARRGGRLFRNDGAGLTYIDPVFGPSKILTADEFFGVAHAVVRVVKGEGEPSALSIWQVKILFTSSGKSELDLVRVVVREPVVIPFANGDTVVSRPGYDNRNGAGVYYYTPPGEAPIEPADTVHRLAECFSGVPFERIEFRNNLLAWLLGSVVFDPLMDPPCLVVSGNQQGIGKSFTVQSAGHILTGMITSPINYSGEEFAKQIGARFRDAERLIFLDNIVTKEGRSFDNPQLSSMLTQGFSKKLRILGKSSSVSASGVLFALSLNDAKLSADMATRSLPVKLFKEVNGPMRPFCKEYAINHRRELYAELLGLAIRPAEKRGPAHENFRFRRWLEFVQPRIEAAFGRLAIDEVQALDAITQELFQFGADFIDKSPFEQEFTAEDLVRTVTHQAAFPTLRDEILASSSDRGRKIKAGRFLAAKVGRVLSLDKDLRLKLVRTAESDKHAGARYAFRRMEEESCPAS